MKKNSNITMYDRGRMILLKFEYEHGKKMSVEILIDDKNVS